MSNAHVVDALQEIHQRMDVNEAVHRDWYYNHVRPILIRLMDDVQRRVREPIWFVYDHSTCVFGCQNTRKQRLMDHAAKKIGDEENPEHIVLRKQFPELEHILRICNEMRFGLGLFPGWIEPYASPLYKARRRRRGKYESEVSNAQTATEQTG